MNCEEVSRLIGGGLKMTSKLVIKLEVGAPRPMEGIRRASKGVLTGKANKLAVNQGDVYVGRRRYTPFGC